MGRYEFRKMSFYLTARKRAYLCVGSFKVEKDLCKVCESDGGAGVRMSMFMSRLGNVPTWLAPVI